MPSFNLTVIAVFGLSFLPSFEGRYALVFGILRGVSPLTSMTVATLAIAILSAVLPLVFPKIDSLMVWLRNRKGKMGSRLASAYLHYIARIRSKVQPYTDRYGIPSLIVFIALPLPSSGVWTGALVAHLLGIGKLKTFIILLVGGVLSNFITLTLMVLGFTVPLPGSI